MRVEPSIVEVLLAAEAERGWRERERRVEVVVRLSKIQMYRRDLDRRWRLWCGEWRTF
jgi:hypothetical protein